MLIEMSKYLGIFVTEATEHLEALGSELVQLEKNRSPELLDSMFRHAHSIKGMAASMGFETSAILAHRAEDLLQAVRADPSLVSGELVDLLLSVTDGLMEHVRCAAESREMPEHKELLAKLSEKVELLTKQPPRATRVLDARPAASTRTAAAATEVLAPSVPQKEPAAPPPAENPKAVGFRSRLGVQIRIAASCQVPGVRAFLVYKRLATLGTVMALKPPIESLRSGQIPDGLVSLELETAAGEQAVKFLLSNVAEVELISTEPLDKPRPGPVVKTEGVGEAAKPLNLDSTRTVRIRTELLDYFLENAGELLLATANLREWGKSLPVAVRPRLDERVDRMQILVKDLHGKVMSARMTPLRVVTDRLPRAARDLARSQSKEVDLVVTGAEAELDRAIIDTLSDPLLHILRNCIDHGLEGPEERARMGKGPRGRLLLAVRRSQERVVLELEDDGRGMDVEKLKALAQGRGLLTAEAAANLSDREAYLLACLPGISTAKDVTELSGRGVGLDAVKRAVEDVGGKFEIDSRRGRGTRFTLDLPLTVSVINLMLARVDEQIVGFPITKVLSATEVDAAKLSTSQDSAFLPHDNALLPVYELSALLRWSTPKPSGLRPYIVTESENGKVALAVDKLLGQEEVVLKALPQPLHLVPGLAGVSILGSGRPIFILDLPRLLEHGLAAS
jgi:two-component system chemotaxis sensor kinase CheA